MKALKTCVAGVDVHKEILAITVLSGAADEEPVATQLECSTFTEDLMAMGLKLKDLGVTDVAMESTGIYWKPPFNVWNPLGLKVIVGNATHIKNVPGRKTDMNDSRWIAELHRFGLIRPSFIPDGEFQRMRLLSRHRTNLTEDLARVKNRVQRVLEDGNIKLGSVVTDVFGVAGIKVLTLIEEGVTRADTLTAAVTTRIKRMEDVKKSLTNCLTGEHCFVIKELMQQYRDLKTRIAHVEKELRAKVEPYRHLVDALDEIPGIDEILAIGIIAEASTDMGSFRDERSFAAWAGVASGNNESAGKKKRSHCRHGNPALRRLLIQAAQGATHCKGSFYRSKYRKLSFRLGSKNKAKVAIANKLARVVYKVLAGDKYKEIGYMRGDPREQKIKVLLSQLRALGVEINNHTHQMIYDSKQKVKVDNTGVVD
jgi:transposase